MYKKTSTCTVENFVYTKELSFTLNIIDKN